MNLATLLFPNGLAGEAEQQLLRQAQQIRDRLPEPTPGSQIAIACGHDRQAFAAALIGVWLKGHGAAVAENSLRERIMPVLDRPPVAMLLHDTESARDLQVPRFLAAQSPQVGTVQLSGLTASPLLTIHVQTEDGALHWCSWNADELAFAIDECAGQAANDPRPAPSAQTPALVSSMFANTLLPLRQGAELTTHAPVDARHFIIPGVPRTMTAHQQLLDEVLANKGISDAAVVCTTDNRILLGVAGPGAAQLASERDHTRAFEQIPRDPNGQPQIAEVFLAFGLGRTGNDITRELAWQVTACEADIATLRTTIPSNYLFYEGHFEGYPVLAGGVQLHELVMPSLRKLCGETPALSKLDSIKFLARIAPGDTIDVVLQRSSDASKLTFEVRKQNTKCTSGRLHFAADLPDLQSPPVSPTAYPTAS
ncbi:MAG: 3-hydroxymyristoyl/3-hydroxydecanoyl-(acyl carrier protein) dehydratase [Planctomycetota bacterium]|jgi:3-hydroxymyristoyl/3-hydroxydecanoyl-(acyl carrier protein) dehydratase